MAAYNDGNTSRHKEWYDPDLQDVNPEIRYLLENYSKIPAAKVVDHVNEIELFLDKAALESRFLVANIFEGESQGEPWTSLLADGVDIIHCSAFFHLLPLQAQKEAAKIIGALVRKGRMIVGRQSASVKPGELPAFQPGTTSFRHDVQTWTEMWTEVGKETGVTWKVEGSLDKIVQRRQQSKMRTLDAFCLVSQKSDGRD